MDDVKKFDNMTPKEKMEFSIKWRKTTRRVLQILENYNEQNAKKDKKRR